MGFPPSQAAFLLMVRSEVGGTLARWPSELGQAERLSPWIAIRRPSKRPPRYLADLPVTPLQANFCDLPEVLVELGVEAVDGILLDLGLSSDQLADQAAGFSFSSTGPLDLRFDPMQGKPAWRLLERLSAEHLADLIYQYGEERYSRRIARAIVQRRKDHPRGNGGRSGRIWCVGCVPRSRHDRIDPATRTFQALRIAVNDELKSLEIALRRLPDCLRPGGRLAVISFHSLEDRRVKEAFRDDPRLTSVDAKTDHPLGCGDCGESAISQRETAGSGSQLTVGCRLHRRPE